MVVLMMVLDLLLWCGCALLRGTDDNFGIDDTIVGKFFVSFSCARFVIVTGGWVIVLLFRI